MAQPLKAGLPPECVLSAGYVIRLAALDPTTGDAVAGVQLSNISFFVTDLISAAPTGSGGPSPLLVPTTEET